MLRKIKKKYSIREERFNVVIEELKQRITAIAEKLRRYQGRVDSYRKKRQFESTQRRFFWEFDQQNERCDDDQPVAEESKKFGANISRQSADHKKDKKWLQDFRSEVSVNKQEKIDIATRRLKKLLGRISNWKMSGSDLVQGFKLKTLSSLHERVRLQLKECLDSGFLPSRLTRGRSLFLQKNKSKDNVTKVM